MANDARVEAAARAIYEMAAKGVDGAYAWEAAPEDDRETTRDDLRVALAAADAVDPLRDTPVLDELRRERDEAREAEAARAEAEEMRSMLYRVLTSWPYQPPEVVGPEREAMLARLKALGGGDD